MHPGEESGAPDHVSTDPTAIPQQRPPAVQPPYPVHAQPYPGAPERDPYAPQQVPYPAQHARYVPHQVPYSAPPAYQWPPQQPYGQQVPLPPAPKPKRRWQFWVGIATAAVLVLCVLPAVGALGVVLYSNRSAADVARKPVAGDPIEVYRDWMVDRVNEALDTRDKALVDGNQATYLAFGDAAKPAAIAVMSRQFAALRQLKVGSWSSEVRGLPAKSAGEGFDAVWKIEVAAHPCFGTAECEASESVHTEMWRLIGEKPRVQEILASTKEMRGPRPWEVADLRAVAGERTIVAASPNHAADLPNLLVQAEKAAVVADRLAVGTKPSRYLIFYAGPAEWTSWYSWEPAKWVSGAALGIGKLHTEIVLNAAAVNKSQLDNLMRHEFTHASTVPGVSASDGQWWMIEGIAEYAEMDGSPIRLYSLLPLVRRLVKSGKWDGKIDVTAPRDAEADADVGAKYGVAFLAIRQLSERYGERRMLEFFTKVVREGKSEDVASTSIFGKPWSTVEKDLATYIQSTVS